MKYQTCVRIDDEIARRISQAAASFGGAQPFVFDVARAPSRANVTGCDHRASATFSSHVVAASTASQLSSRYAYAVSSRLA